MADRLTRTDDEVAAPNDRGNSVAEMGSGGVVTVGEFPSIDRAGWLRERIVRLLDSGVPRLEFVGDFLTRQELVQKGWKQAPGSCSWWALRQRLGGRVGAAEF